MSMKIDFAKIYNIEKHKDKFTNPLSKLPINHI